MKSKVSLPLIILLCSLPFLGSAQNLYFSEDEVLVPFDELLEDVLIVNPSDTEIELAFKLERLCYLPDDVTDLVIILGSITLPPNNETRTWGTDLTMMPLVVVDAESSFDMFEILQITVGNYGTTWDFIMFDRNNPTNTDTINIVIAQEECIVSTQNINEKISIGQAYPSPSKDICTIELNEIPSETELIICNSVGKEVQRFSLVEGMTEVELNLEDYVEGIYFYYLSQGDNISEVQSFIKIL